MSYIKCISIILISFFMQSISIAQTIHYPFTHDESHPDNSSTCREYAMALAYPDSFFIQTEVFSMPAMITVNC